MSKARSSIPDWILAGAAILVVARGFLPTSTAPRTREAGDSIAVASAHWRTATQTGLTIEAAASTDTVVEFIDFECQFCRMFAMNLDSARRNAAENRATIILQHYPLSHHRFAVPAAIAAECASRQGRTRDMYWQLIAKQDSIGIKSWIAYAQDAGVLSLEAFEKCRQMPADSFPRIKAGLELGQRAGVSGTPTVWINGVARNWRRAIDYVAALK